MEVRKQLANLYKDLRVSDVVDGMDLMGYQDLGLMDSTIRPLYRDIEQFSHCFVGFAHTVRLVPTNHPVTAHTPEDMKRFVKEWYRDLARGPSEEIRDGDVIVIDGADTNVGFIGSNNGFGWIVKGAVGIVTNGAARDTDELIKQKCPVYCHRTRPTRRPARLEFNAEQTPINCGGGSGQAG